MLKLIPKQLPLEPQQVILRCPRDIDVQLLNAWRSEEVWVAVDADYIWLRFSVKNVQLMERAKAMAVDRFRLVDRWLLREGQQVAEAQLPDLHWQWIADAIELQLPWVGPTGRAANLPGINWQLSRGGPECPIAGAIVSWRTFVAWVETAAQWRLSRLRYCYAAQANECHTVSAVTRQVLVLGTPVPPLDAEYLVARQNVLVPAGLQWQPALDAAYVARSFDIQPDQWLLWLRSEQWYIIDDRDLVPLTRGSVRSLASLETDAHE